MARRLPFILAAGALISVSLAGTASAATVSRGSPAPDPWAGHAAVVQYQQTHGYLPAASPATYTQQKAQAAAAAGQQPGEVSPTGPFAPVAGPSANGLSNNQVAPSDSTGAVGPNSYIEMINLNIGIYNRALGLIAQATLGQLTGQPNLNLSDPQVLWDPATNRFYYVVLNVATDNFQWGFSKTANPVAIPGGFCNYTLNVGFGAALPDYPKLGDTQHSLLIGANVFNPGYVGSDVSWVTKPAGTGPITTCPAAGSFLSGKSGFLNSHGGGQSFTPVPGIQADPSPTGWIAGIPATLPAASLDLFKVTEAANGTPIFAAGTSVLVAAYNVPPGAPQAGTALTLDTLDGRLMKAVTAVDPLRGGTALWTSHSVAGGAGAQVRWYEINVAASNLYQNGTATSSSLYVFNPAISPDRAVVAGGGPAKFGSDMVMGFNTSSAAANAADQMISKIGNAAQSGFVLVHASPGNDQGFDCLQLGFCRWGDYSSATPDPAANQALATGRVWLTQMYSTGGGPNPNAPEWGTWNWEAAP